MDKVEKYLVEMEPGEQAITDYLSGQRGVYITSLKHALKSLSSKPEIKALKEYMKSEEKLWKKVNFGNEQGY